MGGLLLGPCTEIKGAGVWGTRQIAVICRTSQRIEAANSRRIAHTDTLRKFVKVYTIDAHSVIVTKSSQRKDHSSLSKELI